MIYVLEIQKRTIWFTRMILSDEQLVQEISRGSAPAMELLIQRWDRRLLNYFVRFTGNMEEAEDLRQELFLRVFHKARTFRFDGSFQAWIYRIATNLIIDRIGRKEKPAMQPLQEENEYETMKHPPQGRCQAQESEMQQRIETALGRIPPEQRLILLLRHFENLSFCQIAEILDVPESTVKTRVYRGLDALRKELARLGLLEMDCLGALS